MEMIGLGGYGMGMGMGIPFWMVSFLPLLVIWSIFWKGLALWHSAQRSAQWWFIAMLLINTVGILEIIYLFFILKLKISDLFSAKSAQTSMNI